MEHYAWTARVKPGMLDEDRRRQAEIWPGMVETLREAGICNYTIFVCGDQLFGYYECRDGADRAAAVQAASPVVARWDEYMKDVMDMTPDPVTGAQPRLEEAWRLD